MKLQDLFEMPDFIDKDIEPFPFQHKSYSVEAIERSFDVIKKLKIGKNTFWVAIKKNKEIAVLGVFSTRAEDKKPILKVIAEVEFKSTLDLSWGREFDIDAEHVLQVDGASVLTTHQVSGVGTNLYLALAEAGYVVLSDTTQYRGGRKLWEKLISFSQASGCAVYIIDNGKVIMDDDKPLIYNGTNYSANEIWASKKSSPDGSKRHVLLALKRI